MNPRRLRNDDGAALIEFALLAPFLVILTLGIFEFGMAWRQQLVLSSAIRAAARTDSNLGDNRSADLNAIDAFRASVSSRRNVTIDKLVVYRTTSSDGTPTNAQCLTTAPTATGAGFGGHCNIYGWSQIQTPGSNFSASCTGNTGAAWDHWWCPTSREADQIDEPDYLGVYVEGTYDSYTKMLPNTVKFTDRVVMRIEPKVP